MIMKIERDDDKLIVRQEAAIVQFQGLASLLVCAILIYFLSISFSGLNDASKIIGVACVILTAALGIHGLLGSNKFVVEIDRKEKTFKVVQGAFSRKTTVRTSEISGMEVIYYQHANRPSNLFIKLIRGSGKAIVVSYAQTEGIEHEREMLRKIAKAIGVKATFKTPKSAAIHWLKIHPFFMKKEDFTITEL